MSHIGLVLSGGGARTAFQVGVLKAMNEWLKRKNCPFKVITGSSAGSINAAYLAANADQFDVAIARLNTMWKTLTTRNVYKSELLALNKAKTMLNLFNNMRKGSDGTNSILNASPLARLLGEEIDFERIQYCLDKKYLEGVAITATNFQESMSTTFVQSNKEIQRERVRRIGIESKVKLKHLMASTAIPFLFPPVKIQKQFYGDGSLRNFAPLSSAIRCGAKKLIVVGVRGANKDEAEEKDNISFGDIFSKVLNTILFDSLDIDHERLDRINQTLSDNTPKNTKLREIESVIIRPSVNFKDVIKHYNYECPNILNQLINLIGSKEGSAHLMSYLMFEPGYLNALIDQGYKDAQPYKDQILSLVKNKKALE